MCKCSPDVQELTVNWHKGTIGGDRNVLKLLVVVTNVINLAEIIIVSL